jgi:predicted NACHT family NTPase
LATPLRKLQLPLHDWEAGSSPNWDSQTAADRWDIWDFLAKVREDATYGRLAIIGPPESGKTTLLEYLTLTYARNQQRKRHRKAPRFIPVLIYLRLVEEDRFYAESGF